MKIEFDTDNETELFAVAALIEALSGRDEPHSGITGILSPSSIGVGVGSIVGVDGVTFIPSAPPAVVAPPAFSPNPNPGNVALDSDGLPWDNRIHSTPATINKTGGKWRARKNLAEGIAEAVTAELRQAMSAPLAVPASTIPQPPAAALIPVPPAPEPTPEDAATAFGAAAVTPAASPPPPPPAAASAAPTTFAEVMKKIAGMQAAGLITPEATTDICKMLGLTGIRDLVARGDLIPAFDSLLPVAG